MKLYNKSAVSDETLITVLKATAKAIGANHKDVVIKVTTSQSYFHTVTSGAVWPYTLVNDRILSGKSTRYISCDSYITLRIPNLRAIAQHEKRLQEHGLVSPYTYDCLCLAKSMYSVFAHEWSHVKDFQNGIRYDRSLRKRRHDNRPWERVANKAANKVVKRVSKDARKQDIIINLAIELEQLAGGK